MIDRTVAVSIAGALVLMLLVLEMVRRRWLREEYSLLWLATSGAILGLAGSRDVLTALASVLGIHYPPSALMVVGFGFLTLTTVHFSGVVSRLRDENKTLAQELAVLRWEVSQLGQGSTDGESRFGKPPAGQ
jgi:hypothetical protein